MKPHLPTLIAVGLIGLAALPAGPVAAAETARTSAGDRAARAAQRAGETANRAADKAADVAEKAARRIPYVAEKLDQRAARRLVARRESLPLDEILRRVAIEHPGDVVDVDFERRGELWVYDIKLIEPSGLLRRLEVDASNGKVMRMRDDS